MSFPRRVFGPLLSLFALVSWSSASSALSPRRFIGFFLFPLRLRRRPFLRAPFLRHALLALPGKPNHETVRPFSSRWVLEPIISRLTRSRMRKRKRALMLQVGLGRFFFFFFFANLRALNLASRNGAPDTLLNADGYTPSAIYDPKQFPTDEFSNVNDYGDDLQLSVNANNSYFIRPNPVSNDVFTSAAFVGHGHESSLNTDATDSSFPQVHSVTDDLFASAIIVGHGNDSQLTLNANGFNFTQHQFYPNGAFAPAINANGSDQTGPQFHANGVFAPAISTFLATTNDLGLPNGGGGFANVNDGFHDFSSTSHVHGFNYDNNSLSALGASSPNYDNNSFPATGEYSNKHGNNPLPPVNDMDSFSVIAPPHIADDTITPASPGPLGAAPFVSPVDFNLVGPPAGPPARPLATALGPRHTCPVCHKTYSRLSDLKRHAAKHRAGPKEFNCPATGCRRHIGNRGFTRKDKMKDHVKNKHPEIDIRRL